LGLHTVIVARRQNLDRYKVFQKLGTATWVESSRHFYLEGAVDVRDAIVKARAERWRGIDCTLPERTAHFTERKRLFARVQQFPDERESGYFVLVVFHWRTYSPPSAARRLAQLLRARCPMAPADRRRRLGRLMGHYGLVERIPHSHHHQLVLHGYSICLLFLKLFEPPTRRWLLASDLSREKRVSRRGSAIGSTVSVRASSPSSARSLTPSA
jgi:hypothetical protein